MVFAARFCLPLGSINATRRHISSVSALGLPRNMSRVTLVPHLTRERCSGDHNDHAFGIYRLRARLSGSEFLPPGGRR